MDYYKNQIMDECFERYKKTYAVLLDTGDYVADQSLALCLRAIDKNLKKDLRAINREAKHYKKTLKRLIKAGVIVDPTSLEVVIDDYQEMLRFSIPDAFEIMGLVKPSASSASSKPVEADTVVPPITVADKPASTDTVASTTTVTDKPVIAETQENNSIGGHNV